MLWAFEVLWGSVTAPMPSFEKCFTFSVQKNSTVVVRQIRCSSSPTSITSRVRGCILPVPKGSNTPCWEHWLPQLAILLLRFLWGLTVFLCFCFSCLWYLPSSSSSGLPQTSHGCPECKVVWCWSLLLVGVSVLLPNNCVLRVSSPPSFCCGLCCSSSYLLNYISVMVLNHAPAIAFSLLTHLAFKFSSTSASQVILDPVKDLSSKRDK